MAAPSPKQRAVTMKRNGMDDSLVGAILGLEAAEVRSLLYDADPAVAIAQSYVFEVENLLLPAGTDWSEEMYLLGSLQMDLYNEQGVGYFLLELDAECPFGVSLVLSESPAGGMANVAEHIDVIDGGLGKIMRFPTQPTPAFGFVEDLNAYIRTTGYIGLMTGGALSDPVTVLRARAALEVL